MLRKSILVAAAIALSPMAAFAATNAPAAPATMATAKLAVKTTHKVKHHVVIKKQHVSLKKHKLVKAPATKA